MRDQFTYCEPGPLDVPYISYLCCDSMAATLPFREALNEGIVSGTFVDTKIILFSRRDSSGRVHEPKALYASSHVLKSVPYFNDREPFVFDPDCI